MEPLSAKGFHFSPGKVGRACEALRLTQHHGPDEDQNGHHGGKTERVFGDFAQGLAIFATGLHAAQPMAMFCGLIILSAEVSSELAATSHIESLPSVWAASS
ncbi:hypothetical protein [Paratractidigestivibacter sp.]|uniref:hypothetical protein n=1 Tax=Paratractidigestivibacter sp. TaxID=2847316 RepID=UPI002ABDCE3F|nr:hypothetical protein [Paratractidigestivibacter sp.]